ncbi:hypothetical protein VX159_07775 [Dechloromonas sp. ZY10]|uniref:hypothetical protein n=1 Tax=Dechloromonas aquae TaxID=2664436 RepID=UPI0035272ADF
MPEPAARKLAGPLLLSGLLHLGAGYGLPDLSQPHPAPATLPLRVSIRLPAEISLKPPANNLPPAAAARTAPASPRTREPRTSTAAASAPGPHWTTASKPSQAPPAVDAAMLIERGTAAWREEIRQARARAERQPRLALEPLATSGQIHNGPEVERLNGELVRVTLPDGRRYCLQAPPETLRQQMPLPLLALPANCP